MINKGVIAARNLLKEIGIYNYPDEIPLNKIINGLGARYREDYIDNADGRIVFGNRKALITVNRSITYPGKLRFVAAHELGHFIMHKGIQPVFTDDDTTLMDWYKSGPHEVEANYFASEFLMPEHLVREYCQDEGFSKSLMEDLAEDFQMSISATIYKYFNLNLYPLTIIFSQKGLIKWYRKSDDFPLIYLPPYESKVPVNTVAGEYFYKQIKRDDLQKVYADEWFTDYDIDTNRQLFETCFYSDRFDFVISILWEN